MRSLVTHKVQFALFRCLDLSCREGITTVGREILPSKMSQHGKQLQSQIQGKNKGQSQQKFRFNKLLSVPKCVSALHFPLQSQG